MLGKRAAWGSGAFYIFPFNRQRSSPAFPSEEGQEFFGGCTRVRLRRAGRSSTEADIERRQAPGRTDAHDPKPT
jgi:hypothetical protein